MNKNLMALTAYVSAVDKNSPFPKWAQEVFAGRTPEEVASSIYIVGDEASFEEECSVEEFRLYMMERELTFFLVEKLREIRNLPWWEVEGEVRCE